MKLLTVLIGLISITFTSTLLANDTDKKAIERAVRDYIESQHLVKPEMMERALDPKLAKRTYWQNNQGEEFIMETSYDFMVKIAQTYNKNGDRFPANPRVEINILDIDKRAASVKLTADDWIDYMHLYKNADGQWKTINVLWQYHDIKKHGKHK